MLSMRILAVLALTTLLAGCCVPHGPAPAVPANSTWRMVEGLIPIGESAGVEIMIAYGASTCQHTALWVKRDGKPPLFWDPAGAFGKEHEPAASRRRDLIDRVVSREEYLRFRSSIHTDVVELFRFDLSADHAADLYALLLHGANEPNDSKGYDPNTAGMFCSYAVSEFLRMHAADRFPLSAPHLFPHDFAAELYTFSPDSVLLCITNSESVDVQKSCRQLIR